MMFLKILIFSFLLMNSCSLEVVKEIECDNENDCKDKFENYLGEQKRLFAAKEYSKQEKETRKKKTLQPIMQMLDGDNKDKNTNNDFFLNLDGTSAPGFGMMIPSLEGTKNQDKKKIKAKIFSVSKQKEEHTEHILLREFLFDLLSFDAESNQRTEPSQNIETEKKNLKKKEAIFFIYVNNSPCAVCTERYNNIVKETKIKIYVYYTNRFTMQAFPTKEQELIDLRKTSMYRNCDSKLAEAEKNNFSGSQITDPRNSKKIALFQKEMCNCINEKVEELHGKKENNINYKQINLNQKYEFRIQAINDLLTISNN